MGGEYEFDIDGKEYNANIEFIDKGEIDVTINEETYQAKILKGDEGFSKVSINGKDFQLQRNDLLDTEQEAEGSDESIDVGNMLVSPIPGKIFKIKDLD